MPWLKGRPQPILMLYGRTLNSGGQTRHSTRFYAPKECRGSPTQQARSPNCGRTHVVLEPEERPTPDDRLKTIDFIGLNLKTPRIRMMHDYRRSRLFRHELKLSAQRYSNLFRMKQLEKRRLIFEVRARRIAEAEALTLISLMKKCLDRQTVLGRYAKLFSHSLVPKFGHRLDCFY